MSAKVGERYNSRAEELRWQEVWAKQKSFETANDDPRPRFYVLEMFPIPRAASTWGTSATTRWAMSSPATGA